MGQFRWGRLGVGQEAMFECVVPTARRQTERNDCLKVGTVQKTGRRKVSRVNFAYFISLFSAPEARLVLKRN